MADRLKIMINLSSA